MSEVVVGVVAVAVVLLVFIVAPWRGKQDALDEHDVYTALTGEEPDEA